MRSHFCGELNESNVDEDVVKVSLLKEQVSPEIISKNLAESVYFIFSVSFKELILFFLKSANLSGSVLNPTTHAILGFFLRASGSEFSFTKGIFEVLNPLLAK